MEYSELEIDPALREKFGAVKKLVNFQLKAPSLHARRPQRRNMQILIIL